MVMYNNDTAFAMMWRKLSESAGNLPEEAVEAFLLMKKQNDSESQRKKEEMESEKSPENGTKGSNPSENAVYDVYMMTDSVRVRNVYDGEKQYLTIDDLLLHSGNDIFGEEFIYEGE